MCVLEKTESGPILATISNNHRESGNAGTHNIVPWTSRGLEGYTCEHRGGKTKQNSKDFLQNSNKKIKRPFSTLLFYK